MNITPQTERTFEAMKLICDGVRFPTSQQDIVDILRSEFNIITSVGSVNYIMTCTRKDPSLWKGSFSFGLRGPCDSYYVWIPDNLDTSIKFVESTTMSAHRRLKTEIEHLCNQAQRITRVESNPVRREYLTDVTSALRLAVKLMRESEEAA